MKFLLDSNAWIALFRKKSTALLGQLQQRAPDEIALCSVVLAELWHGAIRSGPANEPGNMALIEQVRARYVSLAFDDHAGREYAWIRARLTTLGQTIGPNDLLIAAIALANGLTLVTHNTHEFSRVPGLMLEDWQTA